MNRSEIFDWEPATWSSCGSVSPYFVVDVFTERPLEGNQLGVFPHGDAIPPSLVQSVARELNLSETVFVLPPQRDGDVGVRIFTPLEELPFAGHPILGTAILLAELLDADRVCLETRSSDVPVEVSRDDARPAFGWMEQPPPSWETYDRHEELLAALSLDGSELPIDAYTNGPTHVYVALPDKDAVAGLRPDLAALAELGVCVNCFAGSGSSWKTRMFAPALGVAEDPATGSAAGPLALHLARHGLADYGANLEICQGEEIGRPSLLHARVDGSSTRVKGVKVGGYAVVVAKGRYRIV